MTSSGYNQEERLQSSSLVTGQWVHVAVVLDGNIGRLYVDGALVDSGSIVLDPSRP